MEWARGPLQRILPHQVHTRVLKRKSESLARGRTQQETAGKVAGLLRWFTIQS